LRGWMGGQPAEEQDAPGASVLAEWNKYSGGSDVEGGRLNGVAAGPAPSASTPFMVGLAGAKFMGSALSGSFNRAASGLHEGATSVGSSVARAGESVSTVMGDLPANFQVPTTQQLTYFAAFFGAGLFFLVIAFGIALPVIVLAPAKFAFSFTMGCGLIMSAFAALKGWKKQVSHMMEKERLPFSLGYLGSMVGTLYAAMVMHSYIFSIACSAAQVVALLYYVMSYFPGGTAGVKFVLGMMYRTATSCFSSGSRAILG